MPKPQIDWVKWNAPFPTVPKDPASEAAYLSLLNLGLAIEESVKNPRPQDVRKTDGKLLKKAQESLEAKQGHFRDGYRGLVMNRKGYTHKQNVEYRNKSQQHLDTMDRSDDHMKTIPVKAHLARLINYEHVALIRFELDEKIKTESLRKMIDLAIENENPYLLDAAVTASVDFQIPLNTDGLDQGYVDVVTQRAADLSAPKKKKSSAKKAAKKKTPTLNDDINALEKTVKKTGIPKAQDNAKIRKSFEKLEGKLQLPENAYAQSLIYGRMSVVAPNQEDRKRFQIKSTETFDASLEAGVTMKKGIVKNNYLKSMRAHAPNKDACVKAHQLFIENASFAELAKDAADLRKRDIDTRQQTPNPNSAIYYTLNSMSQNRIDVYKAAWNNPKNEADQTRILNEQRVYEKLKPMVLRPYMAGK